MTGITLVLEEIESAWTWVYGEAKAIYLSLADIVHESLKGFFYTVIEDLWGAVAAFVKKASTAMSLADLETAFLNTVELVSRDLFAAAQKLGSNLLQALLGIFQAKVNFSPAQ